MVDFYVHESSFVDKGANVGAESKIWHFCHVMAEATIGARCTVGQNTFVGRGVNIGDNCKIQNNVSIYEGVTLEDGVFCGPSSVFTNDINPRSMYPKKGEYVQTLVRSGASIGANATILCGVTVGKHSLIGAGTLVTMNIPDYALAYGVPARIRGWVCECGTKLQFRNRSSTCGNCGRRFAMTTHGIVYEELKGGKH